MSTVELTAWDHLGSAIGWSGANFFYGLSSTTYGLGQWSGWLQGTFLGKINTVLSGELGTYLAIGALIFGAGAVLLLGGKGVIAAGGLIG